MIYIARNVHSEKRGMLFLEKFMLVIFYSLHTHCDTINHDYSNIKKSLSQIGQQTMIADFLFFTPPPFLAFRLSRHTLSIRQAVPAFFRVSHVESFSFTVHSNIPERSFQTARVGNQTYSYKVRYTNSIEYH